MTLSWADDNKNTKVTKDNKDTKVLPTIDVVETAPLPGFGLKKDQIPAPVQTATAKDIAKTNAINLTALILLWV
jgi:hypothetical protein